MHPVAQTNVPLRVFWHEVRGRELHGLGVHPSTQEKLPPLVLTHCVRGLGHEVDVHPNWHTSELLTILHFWKEEHAKHVLMHVWFKHVRFAPAHVPLQGIEREALEDSTRTDGKMTLVTVTGTVTTITTATRRVANKHLLAATHARLRNHIPGLALSSLALFSSFLSPALNHSFHPLHLSCCPLSTPSPPSTASPFLAGSSSGTSTISSMRLSSFFNTSGVFSVSRQQMSGQKRKKTREKKKRKKRKKRKKKKRKKRKWKKKTK